MVKYTVVQGDYSGRMRKWEPIYFGPKVESAFDLENWAKLQYQAPKFLKGNKEVITKATKKITDKQYKNSLDINA